MIAFHHTTTDSTNDAAQRLALLNRGVPVLASARTQTRGRGRHGRMWRSPAGGAWFSVAWPAVKPLDQYAAAPLVVGLAVANAIESRLRFSVPGTRSVPAMAIKWPNDLLLDGRKVAGILCEMIATADRLPTLVVGVGVNANVDTVSLGDGLRHPAVSLREATGCEVALQPLIGAAGRAIADALARLERDGLTATDLAAIESRLAWRGEPVSMHVGDVPVHGVLDGVEPDGRLRLHTPHGFNRFRSGEVSHLRAENGDGSCFSARELCEVSR